MSRHKIFTVLYRVFLLIMIIFLLCSCNYKRKNIESYVSNWIGKEIVFPKMEEYSINGKVNYEKTSNYKIITYVNNNGCLSCKLQLEKWNSLKNNFKRNGIQVVFIFDTGRKEEIKGLLHKNGYSKSILFDNNQKFKIANNIDNAKNIYTFLLNRSNHVIAVGNPVVNPMIKDLYLRIINKNKFLNKKTSIVQYKSFIDYGKIKKGQILRKDINIKNTGNEPLIISGVGVSCDCIRTKFNKVTAPGHILNIKIYYKATNEVQFFETVYLKGNSYPEIKPIEITGEVFANFIN